MSKQTKVLLSTLGLALFLGAGISCAESSKSTSDRPTPPPPLSAEKRQAIHECAAKQGVDLPTPPAGGPKGERPKPPEGAEKGDKPQGGPPHLTEAQRAIVDACFAANGVTPPKGHPEPKNH